MANKKLKDKKDLKRKVYNRKIIRNILKKEVGSNRIGKIWRNLKKENKDGF